MKSPSMKKAPAGITIMVHLTHQSPRILNLRTEAIELSHYGYIMFPERRDQFAS